MDFEGVEQTEEVLSSGEEDAGDERKHNQLLDAISSLDGKKRNKLSQRTVISNQVSEFNFSSSKDNTSVVRLHELVGSLKESASHGDLKNQLRNVSKNKKTVSTPLPKHEKEKIERATAYETTTEHISKWDPIVKKNRKADQLEFPLQKQDFKIVTTDQLVKRFQPRTPLERQVAELLQGSDCVVKDKEQELTPAEQRALQAMDVEEAKQRRTELMKYRALMSYKEAKAKRQKKIKSKRFHRILKKEKLKAEKKQLEKLQQEDPEGYLDKLNQLEKDRAQERVSLKHRGGSKFARKQMIYAKFDDKARQEVQEMLQKSRSLTKKIEVESDSEEEHFPDSGVGTDMDSTEINSAGKSDNPWMARPSSGRPKTAFSRPTQIANNENASSEYSRPREVLSEEAVNVSEDENSDSDVEEMEEKSGASVENEEELLPVIKKPGTEVHDLSYIDMTQATSERNTGDVKDSNVSNEIDEIFEKKHIAQKRKRKPRGKRNRNKGVGEGDDKSDLNKSVKSTKETGNGMGENEFGPENDSDMDGDSEEDANKSVSKNDTKEIDQEEEEEVINNESVNRKRTLEDFDELLSEDDPDITLKHKKQKTKIKNKKKTEKQQTVEKEAYVDPKKLFTLESKIRHVGSVPSVIETENDEDDVDTEEQQRLTIAQAFAEDDVIAEFSREKRDVAEKGRPKDIDLTLPGWGSWGGTGIKISNKKRKRFTIKAPPPLPRKDEHLGHVIMNESRMEAVSKHMVHEIPFPYNNAEQFEKSIRAPLGKTWNPEAVHKELVKPRVVTSLGKVILPMDKSEVSKYEKNKAKSDVKLQSYPGKKNNSKKPVKRLDKQSKGNLKSQQKNKKGPAKHAGRKR